MPHTSLGATACRQAANTLVALLVTPPQQHSASASSTTAATDLLDLTATLGILGSQILSARYLTSRSGPPNRGRAENIMELLHESRQGDRQMFRRLVRVWPEAFDHILALIQDHALFKTDRGRSAEYQLAVFLYRMGRHGNGASLRDIAHRLGLSTGSVVNYTNNVATALFDLRKTAIPWATEDDKIKSKTQVHSRTGVKEWKHGFAMVDGTLVPLQFAPGIEGHFDRKKNYSLNVQLVILPHELQVIEYVVGLPGSTHDSSAFAKSDIFSNPQRYLDPGEWIWGDLGYNLSEHIVSPYSHAVSLASKEFRKFNTAVSNNQIRAEHAIGYLKGRFQALKGLRSLIRDKDSHSMASKLVVAMLVAHNLAIPFDNVDKYIFFGSDQEEVALRQLTAQLQEQQEAANHLF